MFFEFGLAGKTRRLLEVILAEIVLGYQVSQKNRNRILALMKQRKQPIKLYQARTRDYEYGLDLEPIQIKPVLPIYIFSA